MSNRTIVPTLRVDYIHEGRKGLGLAALWRAPLAFLSDPDRVALMGPGWGLDQLPEALSLAAAGKAVAAFAETEARLAALMPEWCLRTH